MNGHTDGQTDRQTDSRLIKRSVLQTCKNQGLFGKRLTHYHTIPNFDALKTDYIAVENIVRKGEIACNMQFLLFLQCFLPGMALIFPFKCTLKCRLQFVSIWTSLKFGNGLKEL